MSLLSEQFNYVSRETEYRCFSCGEVSLGGGYWLGRGIEVIVCHDPGCIESLLHIAVDALIDGGNEPTRVKSVLRRMTTKVLEKKGEECE